MHVYLRIPGCCVGGSQALTERERERARESCARSEAALVLERYDADKALAHGLGQGVSDCEAVEAILIRLQQQLAARGRVGDEGRQTAFERGEFEGEDETDRERKKETEYWEEERQRVEQLQKALCVELSEQLAHTQDEVTDVTWELSRTNDALACALEELQHTRQQLQSAEASLATCHAAAAAKDAALAQAQQELEEMKQAALSRVAREEEALRQRQALDQARRLELTQALQSLELHRQHEDSPTTAAGAAVSLSARPVVGGSAEGKAGSVGGEDYGVHRVAVALEALDAVCSHREAVVHTALDVASVHASRSADAGGVREGDEGAEEYVYLRHVLGAQGVMGTTRSPTT